MWEDLERLVVRLAPERERPVDLLRPAERAYGVAFGPELQAYIRLFERYELETSDASYVELRCPDASVSLRGALQGEDCAALATFVGLFTGTGLLAVQDDVSYLAAFRGTASGASKVYHVHPEDWGLWPTDPSITARLFRFLQEDKREVERHLAPEEADRLWRLREEQRHEVIEGLRDPARLFPRTAWLVHVFYDLGGDLAEELAYAATVHDWAKERALVKEAPELAIYWLWSHHFLGNDEELADVLRLTQGHPAALVLESRDLVEKLSVGREIRLGLRTTSAFATMKERIREAGHSELFSARARRALESRAHPAGFDDEERAMSVLREAAVREPGVREALELLTHFEEGGALKESVLQVRHGLDLPKAMDRFAALVDHRFRTPLLLKLRRAARYPDASPHATWGLFLGLAAVVKRFDEFAQIVDSVGTAELGPRRLAELCRAYGRFHEPAATARLFALAERHVEEIESWDPKVPREAVHELLARDVPETRTLIAAILERASFSGANAQLALRAVEAARGLAARLGPKPTVKDPLEAVEGGETVEGPGDAPGDGVSAEVPAHPLASLGPGLIRALERDLGRIDDGGRDSVIAALVACLGRDAAPVLRAAVEARVERWRADEDPEGAYVFFHKDIACWLGGLLSLDPDPTAVEKAQEILQRFRVELTSGKRVRRDLVVATRSLLAGVCRGAGHALRAEVEPFESSPLAEIVGAVPGIQSLPTASRS